MYNAQDSPRTVSIYGDVFHIIPAEGTTLVAGGLLLMVDHMCHVSVS